MAKNEPTKSGDIKNASESKTLETSSKALFPEKSDSGNLVVSVDKIKKIISEKQAVVREDKKIVNTDKKAQPDKSVPEKETSDVVVKTEVKDQTGAKAKSTKRAEKTDNPSQTVKQEKISKSNTHAKQKTVEDIGSNRKSAVEKTPAQPEAPALPPEPKEAPRPGEAEQIVYLNISDLHAFKDHPFQVRNDEEMKAMVESVKDKGITQPAIVRPREDGGYEIVSGHRRQKASQLGGH